MIGVIVYTEENRQQQETKKQSNTYTLVNEKEVASSTNKEIEVEKKMYSHDPPENYEENTKYDRRCEMKCSEDKLYQRPLDDSSSNINKISTFADSKC
jgi:hypothetical protein